MLLLGALNWSPEWFDSDGLSADELVEQMSVLMRRGLMPAADRPVAASASTKRRA
jgi:hypothetical protein